MDFLKKINWRSIGIWVASIYAVAAFCWWGVWIDRQLNDAKAKELRILELSYLFQSVTKKNVNEFKIKEEYLEEFKKSEEYLKIIRFYERKHNAKLGEGIFAIVVLLGIIFLIHRSYRKELKAATQQRNFLLSITHELKSPLASMKLGFDTLNRRQLNENQLKMVTNNGLKEADRLENLLENLLFSARLGIGYKPMKEEINVAVFLTDIVQRVRQKSPQATIILGGSEVPILRGDKAGLMSVFINLIENAVKYGDRTAPNVEVNYGFEKEKIFIEVKDNGAGIPDKEKAQIFKAFYRIGDEERRQTKGTGLGLHIVKEVVEHHKGIILVNNNKPIGTVFKILLKP